MPEYHERIRTERKAAAERGKQPRIVRRRKEPHGPEYTPDEKETWKDRYQQNRERGLTPAQAGKANARTRRAIFRTRRLQKMAAQVKDAGGKALTLITSAAQTVAGTVIARAPRTSPEETTEPAAAQPGIIDRVYTALYGTPEEQEREAIRERLEQRGRVASVAGGLDVGRQPRLEVLADRDGAVLAALLANPEAAVLQIAPLEAHDRADPRARVDQRAEEGAIAQPDERAGVDGGEQRPGLLDAHLGRAPVDHPVLAARDGGERIQKHRVALHQPGAELPARGQDLVLARGTAGELLEEAAGHPRRHTGELDVLLVDPGQEPADGARVGAARVRIRDTRGECQRSPERAPFSTVRRPQHVGGQDWASSARASLDERARRRRQGREPREAGAERSDAP